MTENNNILLNINLISSEDYDNFRFKAEYALTEIKLNIRKRIIICAIELVQNNLIHNQASPMTVKIFSTNNYAYLETYQIISIEKLDKLKNHIDSINCLTIEELNELRKFNLTNIEKLDLSSPHNGLITCRLKSSDKIKINQIQELRNKEFDVQQINTSILVKFEISQD